MKFHLGFTEDLVVYSVMCLGKVMEEYVLGWEILL